LSRRVAQHKKLFPLLVRDWRAQWKQARLPFLYCQISSISTNRGYQAQYWPDFRDQQRCFLDAVSDIHLAVTSDLGHPTDVHPRNKRDVGHRLALAALAQVYGHGNEFSGPQIDRAVLRGASVILRFHHAQGLRTRDGQSPSGFEFGDAEGVFRPATASIQDGTVVLACGGIRTPTFVRYAWQPFPDPPQNLVNAADLPASTFQVTVSR
jgi:sialate O-acetylesterase